MTSLDTTGAVIAALISIAVILYSIYK
jgi:hypothetical protein